MKTYVALLVLIALVAFGFAHYVNKEVIERFTHVSNELAR